MKQLVYLLCFSGVVILTAIGCKEDDGNSSGDNQNENCVPVFPTGTLPNGATCREIDDCASGLCAVYSHTPTDVDATCVAAPPPGDIHVFGNVRDFMSNELMPNVTIKLGGALDISMNPTGFPVVATLTSDASGIVDGVLSGDETDVSLGIIAVIEADGYYPTSTGLVKPEAGCDMYPAGIRNPDLKVMKTTDLTRLSDTLLASYPALADHLPLGQKGGVVGIIRNVDTGETVSGLTLRSTHDGSVAEIYYLNEAEDAFDMVASTASGIFVILKPGMAETFDAMQNDTIVSRRPATIGETAGILLTTTVQVE